MMNVLQRKMFAEGDVANKSVSEPLIRYYVSQGYNPAEIKAAYPAAPYGLIEQIAIEFGGLVIQEFKDVTLQDILQTCLRL